MTQLGEVPNWQPYLSVLCCELLNLSYRFSAKTNKNSERII